MGCRRKGWSAPICPLIPGHELLPLPLQWYSAHTSCRVEGTGLLHQKKPNAPKLQILMGSMSQPDSHFHDYGERTETCGSRWREGEMDGLFQHIHHTTQAWCCFLSKRLPDLFKTLEKTNLPVLFGTSSEELTIILVCLLEWSMAYGPVPLQVCNDSGLQLDGCEAVVTKGWETSLSYRYHCPYFLMAEFAVACDWASFLLSF